VTADEAPQTRLNGDSVDHEERRPITGQAEHDRPHHESERSIDAYRSLEASAWEPGDELGDGAFAESASGRCRAEQRQDTKIEEGSQDRRRAERDPPPLGAGSGDRRWQRPTTFRLNPRRLDKRGVGHGLRDQERGQTGAQEGSLSMMTPKIPTRAFSSRSNRAMGSPASRSNWLAMGSRGSRTTLAATLEPYSVSTVSSETVGLLRFSWMRRMVSRALLPHPTPARDVDGFALKPAVFHIDWIPGAAETGSFLN